MIAITQILDISCRLFGVTTEDVKGKSREGTPLMVRHLVRALASEKGYKPTEIADEIGGSRYAVYNSVKLILKFCQFHEQCNTLRDAIDAFVPEVPIKPVEKPVEIIQTRDDSGIIRVTQEAYDERFYGHNEKINPRTGNKWFPAFHYLWSAGAPMSPFLVSWYKEYGHEADRIMKHKEQIGSFVHDRIEQMGKHHIPTTIENIENFCRDEGDVLFIKRCLDGFLNFMKDHDSVIVSSEKMILGEDWGGTMDLELRISDDKWSKVWCVDLKTSKSVFEEHLIQVETYRRVCGADRGGVLILGNSTKKRYTFTEIPVKKQDYLYSKFLAVKETAYVTMLERGTIAPTEETFPSEFNLNPENYEIGNRLTT